MKWIGIGTQKILVSLVQQTFIEEFEFRSFLYEIITGFLLKETQFKNINIIALNNGNNSITRLILIRH